MRIAACGQTSAHLPQSMQSAASQIGISAAIERFSKRAVPVGKVPSSGSAETGSRSPLPSSSSAVTRSHEVGRVGRHDRPAAASSRSAGAGHLHRAQRLERALDRGEVALHHGRPALRVAPSRSSARIAASACSRGSTPESAKKQGCITVLMRPGHAAPRARRGRPSITQSSSRLLERSSPAPRAGAASQARLGGVRAVEQEARARRRALEHVEPLEQAELVARDELGALDLVGRADRRAARSAGARR